MEKLAVVGTSWISAEFIKAATQAGFQLTRIYSRVASHATDFLNKNQFSIVPVDTNFEDFLNAADYTTLYLASPNSLHYQQALAAIQAGKNVIVEKPAFTNPTQMQQIMQALAQHPQQFFFEAARHLYQENFLKIKQQVAKWPISGAFLSYEKYSSKYDAFLAGQNPNIFTTQFAGGALQDLGVYLIYEAVSWFGVPETATYHAHKLTSGVDGGGVALLNYQDFTVTLVLGKTAQSYLPSEIYSGRKTLSIDNAGELNQVVIHDGQHVQQLGVPSTELGMLPEARFFLKTIQEQDHTAAAQKLELSQVVNQLLYTLRQSAGIVFPDDEGIS